jgi:hypothetical protein
LLRHAVEQGHTVITSAVIDEAMAIFMPSRMAEKMEILAEDVAVTKLRADGTAVTAICSVCGYCAKGLGPAVKCPVCGAGPEQFALIERQAVEALAAAEGGMSEEEVMPGVSVKWANDAREGLGEIADDYLRRRAKARIEKYARSRRIPVITTEVAFPFIEETVGGRTLGAGAPPTGEFTWTDEAVARLNRIPVGFMRDMTRAAIERVARDKRAGVIDLSLCEEGIGRARGTMNEVIAEYTRQKSPQPE